MAEPRASARRTAPAQLRPMALRRRRRAAVRRAAAWDPETFPALARTQARRSALPAARRRAAPGRDPSREGDQPAPKEPLRRPQSGLPRRRATWRVSAPSWSRHGAAKRAGQVCQPSQRVTDLVVKAGAIVRGARAASARGRALRECASRRPSGGFGLLGLSVPVVLELAFHRRPLDFLPLEHGGQRGTHLVHVVGMPAGLQPLNDVADAAAFGEKAVVAQLLDAVAAGFPGVCATRRRVLSFGCSPAKASSGACAAGVPVPKRARSMIGMSLSR